MNKKVAALMLTGGLSAALGGGAMAAGGDNFERPQDAVTASTTAANAGSGADDGFDEWEQDTTAEVSDPLEKINRGVFWFNEQADRFVIKPVAKGYDWALPKPVKRGVSNVFDNLFTPVVAVSDLLQGNFQESAEDVGRFVVNSTVGVVGVFDVATGWGLEKRREDIGQAFGAWGIGSGPYLVLPILGPSSVRDGVGLVGNYFLLPQNYIEDDGTRWGVIRSAASTPATACSTPARCWNRRRWTATPSCARPTRSIGRIWSRTRTAARPCRPPASASSFPPPAQRAIRTANQQKGRGAIHGLFV